MADKEVCSVATAKYARDTIGRKITRGSGAKDYVNKDI